MARYCSKKNDVPIDTVTYNNRIQSTPPIPVMEETLSKIFERLVSSPEVPDMRAVLAIHAEVEEKIRKCVSFDVSKIIVKFCKELGWSLDDDEDSQYILAIKNLVGLVHLLKGPAKHAIIKGIMELYTKRTTSPDIVKEFTESLEYLLSNGIFGHASIFVSGYKIRERTSMPYLCEFPQSEWMQVMEPNYSAIMLRYFSCVCAMAHALPIGDIKSSGFINLSGRSFLTMSGQAVDSRYTSCRYYKYDYVKATFENEALVKLGKLYREKMDLDKMRSKSARSAAR